MSRFIIINDISNDERAEFFTEMLPDDLKNEEGIHMIGAVDEEGYPEGIVAFSINGTVVDLMYIEVYPELRETGIGTRLANALVDYVSLANMPMIVEASYILEEDSEDDMIVDSFFRSLPDFEVVNGGKYCVVSSRTVWNSKRLKLLSNFSCSVKSYNELTDAERKELMHYLRINNMSAFIEIDEETIIPELSLCHVEEGVCTTCCIFRDAPIKRCIELAFLVSRPGEEDKLSGVLKVVVQRIQAMYPHHNLIFSAVNKESELIAKRFFTKDISIQEIYTALSFGRIY
ncbi:MAG: N-acetyltransferase [Lachnospiraceae bacterium]|nr:N-acetyltransferase [Lachnospiraceae bacterium]